MIGTIYECKKCRNSYMYLKENGPHIGLYCTNGHFITWLNKKSIECNINRNDASCGKNSRVIFTDDFNSDTEESDDKCPWED